MRAWRERGYQGVCHPTETGGEPGRPPSLDDSDLATLKTLLEERPFWLTREVRTLIHEQFDVELSVSQVTRILREKLGMHFGKPYPHDDKRPHDAEAQLEAGLSRPMSGCVHKGSAMRTSRSAFSMKPAPS